MMEENKCAISWWWKVFVPWGISQGSLGSRFRFHWAVQGSNSGCGRSGYLQCCSWSSLLSFRFHWAPWDSVRKGCCRDASDKREQGEMHEAQTENESTGSQSSWETASEFLESDWVLLDFERFWMVSSRMEVRNAGEQRRIDAFLCERHRVLKILVVPDECGAWVRSWKWQGGIKVHKRRWHGKLDGQDINSEVVVSKNVLVCKVATHRKIRRRSDKNRMRLDDDEPHMHHLMLIVAHSHSQSDWLWMAGIPELWCSAYLWIGTCTWERQGKGSQKGLALVGQLWIMSREKTIFEAFLFPVSVRRPALFWDKTVRGKIWQSHWNLPSKRFNVLPVAFTVGGLNEAGVFQGSESHLSPDRSGLGLLWQWSCHTKSMQRKDSAGRSAWDRVFHDENKMRLIYMHSLRRCTAFVDIEICCRLPDTIFVAQLSW